MKKIIIILTIAFSSCNKFNCEEDLRQAGINFTEDFTILKYDSDGALGDWDDNFQLKISDKDVELFIKKVQQTKGYREYKEKEIGEGTDCSIPDFDRITGYKRGTTFYYYIEKKYVKGKANENYCIWLTPDKIFHFAYRME